MRIDVVDRAILLDKVTEKPRVVEDVTLTMKKDIYKRMTATEVSCLIVALSIQIGMCCTSPRTFNYA